MRLSQRVCSSQLVGPVYKVSLASGVYCWCAGGCTPYVPWIFGEDGEKEKQLLSPRAVGTQGEKIGGEGT